ncbi:hypothetical protein [Methylobacter sp.]|uniref:hypothetical protein n=1 Tax=Methylobacter sp. TaxID=2051955 RepID=UPI0024889874|nr:hypothetical protein [Methylobacter sp.]MDI1278051.1 hypothetical protein [Methylobacter sp.]
MARKEIDVEDTSTIIPDDPHGRVAEAVQAVNELAAIERQVADNVLAVAQQLGYDGALTVGALEDEIRFYQRRTVEACLELGKRLLILKELTPHGEFQQRIELLGIGYQTGKKFMAATMKLSKGYSNTLLAAKTQTKMLELLVLDDGEIEALENGGSVRGITLNDIESMSVSELKKALREAGDHLKSKDAVIQKKDQKLNELDHELERLKLDNPVFAHIDWPAAFKGYLDQLAITRKNVKHGLGSLDVIREAAMKIEPASEAEEAALNQAREILATELVGIHNECAEMIAALGMSFDRTLGAYSDTRINLLNV